jgi:LPXTG-motif cell wall-anchored protein
MTKHTYSKDFKTKIINMKGINKMKQSIKRIPALLLAIIFAIMMPISAFATTTVDTKTAKASNATNESTATIVVTSENANDELGLYKIVDAKINSSTNSIDYSFTTDFAAFLASTKDKTPDYSALTIANVLDPETVDEDYWSEVIGNYSAYVKQNKISESQKATTGSDGIAKFTEVGLGQYCIISFGNTKATYVYGNNTAKVVPFAEKGVFKIYDTYNVELKSYKPTMKKSIDESAGGVTPTSGDKLSATVGDPITFKIESTLPTFPAGATNKTLFITDKPSAGLTVDLNSIQVKDKNGNSFTGTDDDTAFADADYSVSYEKGIIYIDLNYDNIMATTSPERVIVTYKAILNDNAVISGDGNDNTATFVYSNDPFNGSSYDPDDGDSNRPDPSKDPAYSTITSKVAVYTFGLVIEKVDSADPSLKLPGATFGIYTDKDCTGTPVGKVTTGDDGYAVFEGIRAGTFYIKELVAPVGYTLSSEILKEEVNPEKSTSSMTTTTTAVYTSVKDEAIADIQATDKDGNLLYFASADAKEVTTTPSTIPAYFKEFNTVVESTTSNPANYVKVAIQNTSSTAVNLPSTGGIGVVPFIAVGSILMIGAAVVLVTRKRMSAER